MAGGLLFVAFFFALFVLYLFFKTAVVVPQQNAYVVERLGRFSGVLEAVFHILVPFVDVIRYRHLLKEQAIDIAEQVCITGDNVQVAVDGILYLKVLASFLAVNKHTGKVVWQDGSPGEGILHGQWSSPALGLVDGVQQVVFPGGDGWLYGFNARTGEKLWRFDLNPKDAVWPKTRNYGVATPVFSGGRVFMSVGQDPDNSNGAGHAYAVNPAQRGDITESGRVWHYDKLRRSISTAAVRDGLLYFSRTCSAAARRS